MGPLAIHIYAPPNVKFELNQVLYHALSHEIVVSLSQ
jgi:hypothetical protein